MDTLFVISLRYALHALDTLNDLAHLLFSREMVELGRDDLLDYHGRKHLWLLTMMVATRVDYNPQSDPKHPWYTQPPQYFFLVEIYSCEFPPARAFCMLFLVFQLIN